MAENENQNDQIVEDRIIEEAPTKKPWSNVLYGLLKDDIFVAVVVLGTLAGMAMYFGGYKEAVIGAITGIAAFLKRKGGEE